MCFKDNILSHGNCTLSVPKLLPALLYVIPLCQLYDQKCLVILLCLLTPLPIQQAMKPCNSANIITNIPGTVQLYPSSRVTFRSETFDPSPPFHPYSPHPGPAPLL